jgi:hypothetical protein
MGHFYVVGELRLQERVTRLVCIRINEEQEWIKILVCRPVYPSSYIETPCMILSSLI